MFKKHGITVDNYKINMVIPCDMSKKHANLIVPVPKKTVLMWEMLKNVKKSIVFQWYTS